MGLEKAEWVTVLSEKVGDFVVELRRLPLSRPRYSIAIGGSSWKDASFRPWVIPALNFDGPEVQLRPLDTKGLSAIVAKMEAWCLTDAKAAEERFAASRKVMEERAQHHKGNVRSPGKTAREKEKRARHEANRIAKAEENRERASVAGSGKKKA